MKWVSCDMAAVDFQELLSLLSAISKDRAYQTAAENLRSAYHNYMTAEADARRQKTSSLIEAMARIDREILLYRREYQRIRPMLSPDAVCDIEQFLAQAEKKKRDISMEKRMIRKGT